MLRAKSLGAVTFDTNTLFIREQLKNESVQGLKKISASGTDISYKSELHNPTITLDSKQWGLLTEAQCDTLNTMWEDVDTDTYTLTYDDDTTDTVYFDYSKDMVFTEIWEGACEYRAIIPLIKAS